MMKNARIHKKQPKPESFDRTQVLSDLRDLLTDMSDKVVKGRIRDKQAFDLKLRALKAFSYGVSTYSNVLDAVENEAIIRRIEKLEMHDGGSTKND
jgi:capsule polysaccharide export protein KpsC/LpsZ